MPWPTCPTASPSVPAISPRWETATCSSTVWAKSTCSGATHDRVTEMDFTIPAVRGFTEKVKSSGFNGVVINITNPCDIVTRELALGLGLPRGRVFGTGTGLDTSRLLSALARQTGVDHKSITCYMLGEHGNLQFAPWSCVSFRGMPLDVWAEQDERFRFDRDALQKESIGGGWVTFSGKFCTEYGIATTAARMASVVLHDEKVIMPASAELCGEYGESGLFAGVPCIHRCRWCGAGGGAAPDGGGARHLPRLLRGHPQEYGTSQGNLNFQQEVLIMNISITQNPHPGTLPPSDQLGFGIHYTDHMFIMDYSEEKGWHDPRIVPFAPSPCPPPPACSTTARRSLRG